MTMGKELEFRVGGRRRKEGIAWVMMNGFWSDGTALLGRDDRESMKNGSKANGVVVSSRWSVAKRQGLEQQQTCTRVKGGENDYFIFEG